MFIPNNILFSFILFPPITTLKNHLNLRYISLTSIQNKSLALHRSTTVTLLVVFCICVSLKLNIRGLNYFPRCSFQVSFLTLRFRLIFCSPVFSQEVSFGKNLIFFCCVDSFLVDSCIHFEQSTDTLKGWEGTRGYSGFFVTQSQILQRMVAKLQMWY